MSRCNVKDKHQDNQEIHFNESPPGNMAQEIDYADAQKYPSFTKLLSDILSANKRLILTDKNKYLVVGVPQEC